MLKKICRTIFMGILAGSFFFTISCENELQNSVPELFKEHQATILWNTSGSDDIETFSAIVAVYENSNRRTGGAKLQSRYRMSVKIVNDRQYVRLDFPATENISAKSLLTDGTESIFIDTETNEIEQRISASELEMKLVEDIGFMVSRQALSRINLEEIKTGAEKLAFDMTESESEEVLCVELPSRYFSSDKEKRLSTKISYDTANELMETVETVTEIEDGSIVTVVTCPVYEELENGQIIKIGQYSIIDTKSPVRYEGLEDLEYFDSLDSIPEMSAKEYKKLKKAGNITEVEDFQLGDPSDPSSIETIVELYEDITINTVDDSAFKLIMEM